ncbi:hypothetical protein EOL73_04420 [Candidatus Saccharibacteria bacterium]|nr:hypothetical protein [Candidatus Saccharibacteria bacterium]
MKKLLVLLLLVVALFFPAQTQAVGLEVTPPEYKVELAKDEKKKGYIDIQNLMGEEVNVKTSVQAFRQTDNNGSLVFFDDKNLQYGILLDLDQFKLGPGETMRMYFMVDGSKLPSGDLFGAIFFTTEPNKVGGVGQSVRLGTLLSITNGTPTGRQAEITRLETNFWQLGGTIKGLYSVRNTSDPEKNIGFYPDVRVSLSPFALERVLDSTLVFAGRERSNDFTLDIGSRFGIYSLKASYGDSSQKKLVFLATGYWLYVVMISLVAVVSFGTYWLIKKRKKRSNMSFGRKSRNIL